MQITDVALLVGAGLAAGAVNAIAGGGSLITFPSLVAAGLPVLSANVTNSIAVCPGYLASVVGSRRDLAGQRRRVAALLPAAVLGSTAGAVLLLSTPARAFELIVPFLVLAASSALALQSRLQRIIGERRTPHPAMLKVLTGVGAVYGGYFGGALGVILMAVFALTMDERLQRVSALKNVVSAAVGLANAVVFALFAPVSWASVALLAPATIAGGYLGSRVARLVSPELLRWSVVTFGAVAGVVLLVRAT